MFIGFAYPITAIELFAASVAGKIVSVRLNCSYRSTVLIGVITTTGISLFQNKPVSHYDFLPLPYRAFILCLPPLPGLELGKCTTQRRLAQISVAYRAMIADQQRYIDQPAARVAIFIISVRADKFDVSGFLCCGLHFVPPRFVLCSRYNSGDTYNYNHARNYVKGFQIIIFADGRLPYENAGGFMSCQRDDCQLWDDARLICRLGR